MENTIRLLKIERECVSRDCDRDCARCDLVQDRNELLAAFDKAVAVLESTIPRVLSMEELLALDETDSTVYVERRTKTYYNETAFVKFEKVYGETICFHGQKSIFGQAVKDYGKKFRCWTSKPTEEQRRATPWQT